jgi:hypothetical protein
MTRPLILLAILWLFAAPSAKAQGMSQESCIALLDKAFGGAGEADEFAIWFEGISYGMEKPTTIFTQPVYKTYKGGYVYVEGKQFEVNLGLMKALSDGKLMVAVDEAAQTMYVDSLRSSLPKRPGTQPDFRQTMNLMFGDAQLSYLGKETVNGQVCHKLRSDSRGEMASHSLYWVNESTGALLLMADWQNGAYDTYWIQKVGKAPKGYDYSVNIPDEELDELHGYKVIDLRFSLSDLYPNR